MSSRNWCFTYYYEDNLHPDLGFYGEQAIEELLALKTRGIIFQEEMGKEMHPHLQGFIRMHRGCDLTRMRGFLASFPGIHLEISRSPLEAIAYCRKPSQPDPTLPKFNIKLSEEYEEGDLVFEQGENSELQGYIDYMKSTSFPKIQHIQDNFPTTFLRYHGGIGKMVSLARKRETRRNYFRLALEQRDCEVHVYYGPTTTGKSTLGVLQGGNVTKEEDMDNIYFLEQAKGQNDVWFSDYDGETILFIDDFKGWIPYKKFIKYLRRVPQPMEGKGTTEYKNWNKVIISCSCAPWDWYRNIGFPQELRNRITYLWYVAYLGAPILDHTSHLDQFVGLNAENIYTNIAPPLYLGRVE